MPAGQARSEDAMFMSIRSYRVDPAQREEIVRRVDEGWADELRQQPGFVSYYVVTAGPDELVSVTAVLDEDDLARVVEKSAEWVGAHLMDLKVEMIREHRGRVASHAGD
jgi:heme-degrading monooxygenase HmoA